MARDNRIDSLKGLLIILVILGHVITTIDNVNIVNHAVMGFIYIFHMPLFILISGYLIFALASAATASELLPVAYTPYIQVFGRNLFMK